jgi:ribonuclease J
MNDHNPQAPKDSTNADRRDRIRTLHNETNGAQAVHARPARPAPQQNNRPAGNNNQPRRDFRANVVAPTTSNTSAPQQNNRPAGNNNQPRRDGHRDNRPQRRDFNRDARPAGSATPHTPRAEGAPKPQGNNNGNAAPRNDLGRPTVRRSVRNMRKPRTKTGLTNRGKMGDTTIPPVAPGTVRVIPLGGVEEIGKNMVAIETSDAILIVDAGLQFKEPSMPGIDYVLPNTKYLEERKDKIKALFITHGHLDHVGGIPFMIEKLGYPPVYTRPFGAMMVIKRQEEFPHLKKLDVHMLADEETVTLSPELKVTTFPISHTIPDSMGLLIDTPAGVIALIEDVRVDNIAGVVTDEEVEQYKRFKDKDILLLTMDSTSVEKPGYSLSEQTVVKNIEKIMREVQGRLVIATFASQVERIVAMFQIARQLGKKVAIDGRSMKTNIEIVKHLKIMEPDNLIPLEEVENHPPDRVVLIVTGAQGEEFAALMRIVTKTHKSVRLRPTDTIMLSSSIIPTNHLAVVKLKDNLYRSGAKIITYLDSDIHASGHGNREELRWIHERINYKFFMPVHGYHYLLKLHADLAMTLGAPKNNVVVPENGTIVDFYKDENGEAQMKILKEKAPSNLVMVDGFAVGDMQEVVLRDRQMLSDDGMFVVVSVVGQNGRLRKSPDIISRGFVYLRESQELLRQARFIVKRAIEDGLRGQRPHDVDGIKDRISDELGRYLFQQTAKRPIVIPVIIEV